MLVTNAPDDNVLAGECRNQFVLVLVVDSGGRETFGSRLG